MEGVCKEQRKHKATHLSGTMRIRIQTISNLGIHISQSPELAPNEIEINTLIRAKAEPKVPLKILWTIDSLDRDDGPAVWYHFVREALAIGNHKGAVNKPELLQK